MAKFRFIPPVCWHVSPHTIYLTHQVAASCGADCSNWYMSWHKLRLSVVDSLYTRQTSSSSKYSTRHSLVVNMVVRSSWTLDIDAVFSARHTYTAPRLHDLRSWRYEGYIITLGHLCLLRTPSRYLNQRHRRICPHWGTLRQICSATHSSHCVITHKTSHMSGRLHLNQP